MKNNEKNLLFQRYNLKHNRLWSQGVTFFSTLITIISAFAISMYALSINPENKIIIFKEYIILLTVIFLFTFGFTITIMSWWTNRKLLLSLLPKTQN